MEVFALCEAVAADRRVNPRDDIMTALVQAEVDGHRLDDMELNLFFVTLVVAGNETTRNLINHSMLALMDHPEQAQMLRDDPSLWDSAVEEMLRWGSSIQIPSMSGRLAYRRKRSTTTGSTSRSSTRRDAAPAPVQRRNSSSRSAIAIVALATYPTTCRSAASR